MRKIVSGKPGRRPAVILSLPIDPELKALISQTAVEMGLAMNELVAKTMAESLGRPDLALVPRKPFGRPPIANGNGHSRKKVAS